MLSLEDALSQLLALAEPVADEEEVDTIERTVVCLLVIRSRA